MIVVSLFDASGAWSRPLLDAGHAVLRFDLEPHDDNAYIVDLGRPDAAAYARDCIDTSSAAGHLPRWTPTVLLAAPPCTCFTRAGARLWPEWDTNGRTAEHLRLVDVVLELHEALQPVLTLIENPPGRLWKKTGGGLRQDALGAPSLVFDPCDYGGWAPDDPQSRWTKKTYIWAKGPAAAAWTVAMVGARQPLDPEPYPEHLPPGRRDPVSRMSSSWKKVREKTAAGFAAACAASIKEVCR